MTGWQAKVGVVALAIVLGLLQGARTALGRAPLASRPAPTDVAAPPALERDWRAGSFYRPPGSNAVRPPLALRPSVWRPERAVPVARACPAHEGGSC